MPVVSIKWFPEAKGSGGHVELLDQTKLPLATYWIKCSETAAVIDAIKRLAVRGAPAIGIAGAYAYCLAAQQAIVEMSGPDGVLPDVKALTDRIGAQSALIAAARPTAVNLQWAVDRMNGVLARYSLVHSMFLGPTECCSFTPDSSRAKDGDAAVCAGSSSHAEEMLLALCQEVFQALFYILLICGT
jgi:methylthioribose-1-phosphate isomerase